MEKEQEKAAKAREAALKGALTQIERTFGAGSIMKMGDDAAQVRVAAVPTGAISLDLALGVGGVPRGRIVEVFGPESSGKTTLIYHVLANAQKHGGICAFIDAERQVERQRARGDGGDPHLRGVVPHLHDRALPERPLDLRECALQRSLARLGGLLLLLLHAVISSKS